MEKIVFTNGCFDILHLGHIDLLQRARELGTKLYVGINSDESIRKIKGFPRPFIKETERAKMLAALKTVDKVYVFDELTPENLIKEIKPDVLVKGGDWSKSEIIGADFVESYGGEVLSLKLFGDYSTSKFIDDLKEKISVGKKVNFWENQQAIQKENSELTEAIFLNENRITKKVLTEHFSVFQNTETELIEQIEECADEIFETFARGKKLLICGNGGSAADAQHIAAEFVGRYETERRGFPAIALTTDTSALTAISNDYSFEKVFSRQVSALASEGDLLLAISTSGNSPNVIAAVMEARKKGCKVIGLTGAKGKKLASLCDHCLLIPSEKAARIQEVHITIAHIWCEIFDLKIAALGN